MVCSYSFLLPVTIFIMHLFTSSGVHVGDQTLINNVAGFMIEQLTDKYPNKINIANLTSSHLFGSARFVALHGSLSDIHQIERSGDVIVESKNQYEMAVTLALTFKELKVEYTEFTASFMGISIGGSLEATARENKFSIFAKISEKSNCFISLHDFDVINLGDFEVKLEQDQCSLFSSEFCSKAATFAVNYFKENARKNAEESIHKAMRKHIPHSKFICLNF